MLANTSMLWSRNLNDGGGGHWLVRMDWCPAGWSMCLPLLIFPCTIKSSRSSLPAPAHPGGPRKRDENGCGVFVLTFIFELIQVKCAQHPLFAIVQFDGKIFSH